MELGPDYQPEFESLKELLLDMALERDPEVLLRMIVDRLAARPHVALARIWLILPGDICTQCPRRKECPDQSRCLHLMASAGRSRIKDGSEWKGTDGDFRRFPLGIRKVGRIASSGEGVVVTDLERDSDWVVDRDWIEREDIRGFVGQPLVHKGEILGVIAVFMRIPPLPEGFIWLRMICNHTGAAVANARAFAEIERLKQQLELECAYLRQEVKEARIMGDLVGRSSAFRQVLKQIELVAPTDASVLILGESGTGKELVAREIHNMSRRSEHSMIKVNCASIPRELYESEFFGHVKGSFTGAVKDRAGRFEAANEGTLFLDEVGEIPLELQSKLLRVLQEGQYERVGEETTREVNVRIITATNRDMTKEIQAGRFRKDLFYRINVFPIEIAPLRERQEDIPLLASHFLKRISEKVHREPPRMTQANVIALQNYDWLGNARELRNVIERALITSPPGSLRFDLPGRPSRVPERPAAVSASEAGGEIEILTEAEMRQRERENILLALQRSGWKVHGAGGAAELLDMKPTTLASRIKKMGLKKP